MENPLRQNFFRAGHAHAGVIVILSLICQVLADAAILSTPMLWFVRIGVPLAAILISSGFFFSMLPPTATVITSGQRFSPLRWSRSVLGCCALLKRADGNPRRPRVLKECRSHATVTSITERSKRTSLN